MTTETTDFTPTDAEIDNYIELWGLNPDRFTDKLQEIEAGDHLLVLFPGSRHIQVLPVARTTPTQIIVRGPRAGGETDTEMRFSRRNRVLQGGAGMNEVGDHSFIKGVAWATNRKTISRHISDTRAADARAEVAMARSRARLLVNKVDNIAAGFGVDVETLNFITRELTRLVDEVSQ